MRTSSTRTLLSVFILLMGLIQSAAQTNVSGIISTNTTWTKANSPYNITGNTQINAGVALTIDPGVEVYFTGNFYIKSLGTISSVGSVTDSIRFYSNSSKWAGIQLINSSTVLNSDYSYESGSVFKFTSFKNSTKALFIYNSSFYIENCLFQDNTIGLEPRSTTKALLKGSKFVNNTTGIYTEYEDYTSGYNVNCIKDLRIENNVFQGNPTGANINMNQRTFENLQVLSNTFLSNTKGMVLGGGGYGPYLANVLISKNKFISNGDGLSIEQIYANGYNGCSGNLIYSMIIENNLLKDNTGIGMSLRYSGSNHIIRKNVIINNSTGIRVMGVVYALLFEKNTIIENKKSIDIYGAYSYEPNNLTFRGNTFKSSDRSSQNFIIGNNVTNNNNRAVSNNFSSISTIYLVKNNNRGQFKFDSNYVKLPTGITDIGQLIYDMYDEVSFGEVITTNPSPVILSSAPVSPVLRVAKEFSSSALTISWSANSEPDIKGYKIYYGSTDGYSYSNVIDVGNVTSYTMPAGISVGETIAVTAYDESADGVEDQIDGSESWFSQANQIPLPPASLTADSAANRVKLAWSTSTLPGVNSYNVYRSTDGSTYRKVATTGANTYIDISVLPTNRYYYKVTAFDSLDVSYENYGLESNYSNVVTATPNKILYVDGSSGSNNNLGSFSFPFRNIQAAVDSAADGDTLILKRGIYPERVNFKGKELTLSSTYVLDFDTAAIKETVIDASQVARCSSCGDKIIRDSLGSQKVQSLVGLTLKGAESGFVHINIGHLSRLIFEGNRLRPGGASGLIMGDRLVVDSCIFRNNGLGDLFPSGGLNMLYVGTNSSFTNNQVYNNNVPGHYIASWGVNMLVKNNTFLQNSYSNAYHNATGIILSFGASLFSVENNVFANNNKLQAIYANIGYPASSPSALYANTITNNTLFNNSHGDIGLMLYQGSLTIQNNIMYILKGSRPHLSTASMGSSVSAAVKVVNNIIGAAAGDVFINTLPNYNLFDSAGSTGNIGGYPSFADTTRNDFRLRPSSIALGRGVTGAAVPEKDIVGTHRPSPVGSLPDIGALESPYGFAAPTLTSVEGGNGQAVLYWSDAPVQGVTKYKLYRATVPIADTATIGVLTDTIGITSRQFADAGLTNGTRYYYRLKSVTSSGEESGMSNELVARPNTPPARPDTLVAKGGPGAVQLSWPVVAGAGLKYQVFRGTVSTDRALLADTFATNVFFDTTVAANTRYYYTVRAVDSFGVVSAHSPVASAVANRVWWVDASGSNRNIGTSEYPLQQIAYALEKIASGDTIIVKKGTYNEVIRLRKNVVLASEYLLTGNKDLIDQTILSQDPSTSNYHYIYTDSVHNYTKGFRYEIVGFTVKDVKRYGYYMTVYDGSVRDMKFTGNAVDDLIQTGGRSEIRNSVFLSNKGRLINAWDWDSTARTKVINCQFLNNEAWWLNDHYLVGALRDLEAYNLLFAGNRATRLIDARGDSVVLQHLTMVSSGNTGAHINTSKYAEIRNSIIVKNLVDVRFEKAPARIVFRNNLLTQREQRNGSGYDTTGFASNLIGIDPSFLDSAQANYRLSPASLALGQGDRNVAVATDLDGQHRPLPANTNPDLGAYEHALAAPKPVTSLKQVVPYNKASLLYWSHFPDTLAVRKFRVYRGLTPGATTVVKDSLSRGQTQYTDTNLVNNTTYYYRLRAVDTTGAELDFSNELSVVPYNKKPMAGFLSDRRLPIGFTRDTEVSITPGSYSDADGVVDSLAWYVNGVRLSNGKSFTGRMPQGTNKVQYVVWDNDGASDTATAYYHIYARQVSMKAFPRYGVSAFNRSNIFVIDTVLGTMPKSAVLRLDSLLNPSAGLNTFKVDEGISSEASVSADSIVFIPNGTKLDAFKVNGQPHFQSPLALGGIVNVTPTVDNKRKVIYLGLDNKNFMAISYKAADNGAVKWNYVASGTITSPAVLTRDGKLLFTDATGRLYGFELEQITSSTPAPRWNYYVGGPIRKALALDTSGNVVLATNTALLKLRLKSDGTVEELFKNTTAFSTAPVNTAPVLDADGNIIVGQTNGVVSSVSGTSGSVRWSYNTGTSITSTPSISAYGHIYVLNEKSKLVVLNTEGALQWFFAHGDTAMLAKTTSNTLHVKGTTLISSGFGGMYAFYDVPEGISSDELRMAGSMAPLRVPMWETYQGNIGRSGSGGGSTVTNVVTATPDVVFNNPSWKVYRSAGGRSLLVERVGPASVKARAIVYDMAGRPIEGFDVGRRLTERPLPRLISGIYLVVIHEKDKTSVYKIFL